MIFTTTNFNDGRRRAKEKPGRPQSWQMTGQAGQQQKQFLQNENSFEV
jgi:hypothetical protein